MKRLLAVLIAAALLPAFYVGERDRSVTLVAVGDDLIHQSVYKSASAGDGFDFYPAYENVADIISGADIAFVNQETMLGTSGYSGYPRFCSPVEVGEALVGTGFDVINIANNHSLDCGEAGFLFTNAYLSGIAECVIGDGGVKTVERNGIKIAFLSYTYATNSGTSPCVSRFDENTARREIAQAKQIADAVVVSMHWGVEYDTPRYVERYEPTQTQTEQARFLASLGADVIIGTHPHVIERAEWIYDGDRRTFCAYSLGNFLSNMRYGATCLGGMLELRIVKCGEKTEISHPRIIPIVCHYGADHRGHRVYTLNMYTDALAASHGTQSEGNEMPFCKETLTRIYNNNIDKEFR